MKINKYLPLLLSTVCIYGSTIATPIFQADHNLSASASTLSKNRVNGRNVKRVEYGHNKGFFQQQANGTWIEKNADGQFTFRELGRDDWSVYLLKSDGLRIQLDLHRQEVIWMGQGKLYDIKRADTTVVRNSPTRRPAQKVQFGILNYNAMLLDNKAFPNHRQDFRAGEIPQAILGSGQWDVIIINEAFLNSARHKLQQGLQNIGYRYGTQVVDQPGNLDDGGVFIQSRLPIKKSEVLVFDDCSGSDCLSNKGAMYVQVEKNGRTFHIFGTHLQSSRGKTEAKIRAKQIRQLQGFIARKVGNAKAKGDVVLIGGDLNFDPRFDTSEYRNALSALNATVSGQFPSGYTFDPKNNSIAKYRYKGEKREWLDYIFVAQNGSVPSNVKYDVMKFRSAKQYNMPAVGDPLGWFDKGTNHYDLSDHYGLSARFTF
ncbi:MAG: sphingomyelin phosphodiesterase [Xenococcus sp. (in: cyanobacteria)]